VQFVPKPLTNVEPVYFVASYLLSGESGSAKAVSTAERSYEEK
jgi:hypothetical protein